MPLPDAFRAHISMIPKNSEDASEPQAFWPISLLSEDLKILGKILCANWYTWNRVGFVPRSKASDNVRKVVHLIQLLHHWKIPGFLLSLNIYKVFGNLSWKYLLFLLSHWDFGEAVLTWIKALYSLRTSTSGVRTWERPKCDWSSLCRP